MIKVLGIGNAVLDVVAKVTDEYLIQHSLKKGTMCLVEEQASKEIYSQITPVKQSSGGSVANTIVGISILGENAGFCGKVKNDELGKNFIKSIKETGASFLCEKAISGLATARCIVLVTPDGERTMQTFLGASTTLSPEDLNDNFFDNLKYILFEGYLWSSITAREALYKAVTIAKRKKIEIIFSLSDPGLVGMFKDDFYNFIKNDVDVLIGNQMEYETLLETNDVEESLNKISNFTDIAVITLGEKGAVAIKKNKILYAQSEKNLKVLDTTGAGDMFASGLIFELCKSGDIEKAIKLGCRVAGKIISQYGARPEGKII